MPVIKEHRSRRKAQECVLPPASSTLIKLKPSELYSSSGVSPNTNVVNLPEKKLVILGKGLWLQAAVECISQWLWRMKAAANANQLMWAELQYFGLISTRGQMMLPICRQLGASVEPVQPETAKHYVWYAGRCDLTETDNYHLLACRVISSHKGQNSMQVPAGH